MVYSGDFQTVSEMANCAWHKLFNFPDTFRTRWSTADRIHTLVQVLKFQLPSENTAQLLQNLSEIENNAKRHVYSTWVCVSLILTHNYTPPTWELCLIYSPHHSPCGWRCLQLALAKVGLTQKLINWWISFKVHLQTRSAYVRTTQLKTQGKTHKGKTNYFHLVCSNVVSPAFFYI